MATKWLPVDLELKEVLKKLPLLEVGEAQREGAFREAQLMRKISRNCPFITQFHEVLLCRGGTVLCLIMEYCSGGDLRGEILRRRDEAEGRKFAEDQLLRWAAQIALALQHCHSRGILHRDVKPGNCFFRCPGGALLLGDFGISCDLDEHHLAKTCCGSPLYLSPEIVNQQPYAYASDVWSFGITLYEMAMLVPPFKGSNICQVAFRIVGTEPPPLEPGFSSALAMLIHRLLVKEASNRATLDEALHSAPLAAVAAAVAAEHGLRLEPLAGDSSGGLVERLRRTMPSHCQEEYADDFDEEDESDYGDDFEDASGSDISYAPDFETASDSDDGAARGPELSEEDLRLQVAAELGEEAMAIAESLGVVSFLESLQRHRR
ncbi:NEK5 [Symbiodinium natans]|uniref:non-specific serine/threonine protein kinase n=1 Tax=Symbiodinium natans TaxID=878477 RepID=A0A812KVK9_9DINO|nr:NEK5 [Symbiodinium natans]